MPELVAPDARAEFQYASPEHQASTALAGIWAFLASEILFFGGLVWVWWMLWRGHPAGFAHAAQHSNLLIGSINTGLLLTSSLAYTWGVGQARQGRNRRVQLACLITAGLGLAFLGAKGLEWYLDIHEGLFPGPGFSLFGPDRGGAQLFYSFYFVGTALHGVHMLIGLGLVGWVYWRARHFEFTTKYSTPVEAVGLYWSFVDVVWLTLYPLIYLVARP